MNKLDVIFLMGGEGKRARLGYPKQYARIGGIPIFIHSIQAFLKEDIEPYINKIIIVAQKERYDEIEKMLIQYNILKFCFHYAGKTRQESVYNGLQCVKTKHLLITEAVRPFQSSNLIKNIINNEKNFITPISQPKATVIDIFGNSYDRNRIGEVQMPQKYSYDLLHTAHEIAKKKKLSNFTDDSDLVINIINECPYIIKGEEPNIKITTPLDLKIANIILSDLGDSE
jgi:2-C-methyl-D-erythritol 4-phosphate cytidylyltransferase